MTKRYDNEADDYESEPPEVDTSHEMIGLFGAHGATGQHFVKLALDAGYSIQALAPCAESVELQNEQLTVIEGSMDDVDKIEQVISGATFVVCMLGDTLPKRREYKENCLLDFVKTLYPLMQESSVTLFLYQANSLTNDLQGKAPIFSRIIKATMNLFGVYPSVHEHDNVVKYVVENANDYFHFIVTRPGILRNGPSKKRLTSSRSLPGPVPVTNADLAEFSLGALMEEKLWDTTPFVVGDGK